MLSTFSNRSLTPIMEAYRSMNAPSPSPSVNEALTIPPNPKDDLERQLYSKLDRNYKYADAIVRWFRNDRKALKGDDELQRTYVYNLKNIIDMLKDYDTYIAELQRSKALKDTVALPSPDGGTWKMNPIRDFPSIRRLDGAKALVKYLGDVVHSTSAVKTTNSKYAITDADRRNIRLVGFTENVCCWATRTFESTNKFVFQLWRNADTMDRGDAYGDPSNQSPYCTHAISHWNSYSEGYPNYEQYWFLRRITSRDVIDNRVTFNNVQYSLGDLSNPSVVSIFNAMAGTGPDTLIAMNDTGDDFLDRDDSDFGEWSDLGTYGMEVAELDKSLFVRNGEISLVYDSSTKRLERDEEYEDYETVALKSDAGSKRAKLSVCNVTISNDQLTKLPKGIPSRILGDFDCSGCDSLVSLAGAPKEIGGTCCFSGCGRLGNEELMRKINVPDMFKKVMQLEIRRGRASDLKVNDDMTAEFKVPFDNIKDVYDGSGRDEMEFDTMKKILNGDSYSVFDSYDVNFDISDVRAPGFDEMMSEFGVTFDDMRNIYEGEEVSDEAKDAIDDYKYDMIQDMLSNDFHDGNGIYVVYCDCVTAGTADEAYSDIASTLCSELPIDRENGLYGNDVLIKLSPNQMCEVVRNYNDNQIRSVLQCFCVDRYGDYNTISVTYPQYGYDGFNDDMWKEAVNDFSNRVYKLLSSKTPVKDIDGQQFFAFDNEQRKR